MTTTRNTTSKQANLGGLCCVPHGVKILMIALPGEFGTQLEDWIYITEQDTKLFIAQSPSLTQLSG